MKASRLHAYGAVDQFKYEDVPTPVAGPGEVLVKIEASGLNPVDLYVRQGYLAKNIPLQFPAIIGLDAAGTVAAVGAGVEGLVVGDRVVAKLPIGSRGAHAEFAVTTPDRLAHLANTVSFEAGATIGLAGLTARQAVDVLNVKAGEHVLVGAALLVARSRSRSLGLAAVTFATIGLAAAALSLLASIVLDGDPLQILPPSIGIALNAAAAELKATRPTAINLAWAVDEMIAAVARLRPADRRAQAEARAAFGGEGQGAKLKAHSLQAVAARYSSGELAQVVQ